MRTAGKPYDRIGDERGQALTESLILPFVAMVGVLAMSMVGLAMAAV
jgi:hypothetical protein